ncbi:unnamed protein product [Meloidogyne enterolobii]|uniref:Uncharacterized protein n=1 Tax=Meloidogyne enterolobii TaxID=390850 RepID=A0ACB0YC52_MELEN
MMKLASLLTVLFFNWILLITVTTVPTEKGTNKGEDKEFKRSKYNKEYYQKNKERKVEYRRNYYKANKQKLKNNMKIYYHENKETRLEKMRIYQQNNREKLNEYKRKYGQEKKNVQSDNNEGTSNVNPQTGDFTNKGKLPIVCEEKNLLNQGEGESNKAENKKNQMELEEANKIYDDGTDQVDSNKKVHPFDLNEKPDDSAWETIKNNGFFSLSNPLHSIFKRP